MHELPAYSPLGAADVAAALREARSGDDVRATARRCISRTYDADRVLLTDSGRSALHVAVSALVETKGKNAIVAIPAFQCYEVATAVANVACRLLAYDVDPGTLAPELKSLEKALERGAQVVIVAPLYGIPVDWRAISDLANRYGASVIEDAAQGHGAMWQGRTVGSLGDVSVVSFGRGKGWTGADGGAVLLRNAAVDLEPRLLRQLSGTGSDAAERRAVAALMQVAFGRPFVYGIPASIPALQLGQTIYHEPTPASRMNLFSAALLVRTEQAAAREARVRRENAAFWDRSLASLAAGQVPRVAREDVGGYLRYPLRVPRPSDVRDVARIRRLGIARSYPMPLTRLPTVVERLALVTERFPGADTLVAELVTLPTHSMLSARGRAGILTILEEWFGHWT